MDTLSYQSVRVLLLDKQDTSLEVVRGFLGDEYEIVKVQSISKALSYIYSNEHKVALVLVSIDPNTMDGLEYIKDMEAQGILTSIPVVAMANNPSELMVDEAYLLGVADFLDLSENQKRTEKRLRSTINVYMKGRARERYMAENDALTGALNFPGLRRRFAELVDTDINIRYVVVFSDIQNFKYFNTTFGFEVGNYLLKYWFETVKKYNGPNDLLCRISGDQMVTIIPEEKDQPANKYADVILEEVRNHFASEFGDYTIHIVSGVYIYDPAENRGEDFDQIIGYARQAQKSVKDKGGSGVAEYDEAMWAERQQKIEINGHVEAGLQKGEISVHMQPQYNSASGELIGAECLCRWKHEVLGPISPGVFVPALEETGKIYLVDQFVWETACQYLRKWLDMGFKFSLSVNISRSDLKYSDLPNEFMKLIKKYDLTPDMLRIEITESAYMDKTEPLTELIHRFAELGFLVEMDDFGSGFSNLNMLHETEIDIIKLDMGFLKESENSSSVSKGGSIINAMVKMAHALDIRVLAEGVETVEQADFLKSIGCLMVQGYYFSKPLPADEFEKLVLSSSVAQIKDNYDKYQAFNLQDLFDRKSSGFFIFNYAMGPAVLFDMEKGMPHPIVVNERFCQLVEWKRGNSDSEKGVIFPSFDQEAQNTLLGGIRDCVGRPSATVVVNAKKINKYIQAIFRHITMSDGMDLYFVEAQDVTKQKQMENEIAGLVKKLQTVLEVPGVVLYEYFPDTDKMVFNYKNEDGQPDQRVAEHYLDILPSSGWMHSDFIEGYVETLKRAVETGLYHNVLARPLFQNHEYHLCKYHFSPIADESGKVRSVIIRAEKIEEEMADSYFEGLPVGTFRYKADKEQKFDYISQNLLKMLGFSSEREFRDFYKDSFLNFVHPDDIDRVLKEIDEQIKVGDNDFCEYRVLTPDGGCKRVYDRGTIIQDENGDKWFYVAVSDVDDYMK